VVLPHPPGDGSADADPRNASARGAAGIMRAVTTPPVTSAADPPPSPAPHRYSGRVPGSTVSSTRVRSSSTSSRRASTDFAEAT